MLLSKRLQTIANMVPKNRKLVDIGCDHALLDIYLTLHRRNKCIAVDVKKSVLAIAKQNIKQYHMEDEIELILSDGLAQVDEVKDAVAVIAGMGTTTILRILNSPKIEAFSHVIIQTNNEWEVLRKQFSKKGYYIEEEEVVLEKNKYYVLMKWKKGKKKYSKRICFLGPILKEKKCARDYYQFLFERYHRIILEIPKYHLQKRHLVKQKIRWIQKELKRSL